MNTYSIYDATTGVFAGVVLSCPAHDLILNLKDAQSCVIGTHDHLSKKVDVATGEVVDYIPPQPSVNHAWDAETKRWVYVETDSDIAQHARAVRKGLLVDSGWTQENDSPLSAEQKALWATYRQALRDISLQPGFPRTINWPVKPEST